MTNKILTESVYVYYFEDDNFTGKRNSVER